MRELTQTFRFPDTTASQLAHVMATAPLVGDNSIFGNRTVESTTTDDEVRRAIGFEPAPIPLLRFDVEIRQKSTDKGTLILFELKQPKRRQPYLAGQFIWQLEDEGSAAVLHEHINTPTALALVDRPVHGSPLSFRRWLFFNGGHERLTNDVVARLRDLAATQPPSV